MLSRNGVSGKPGAIQNSYPDSNGVARPDSTSYVLGESSAQRESSVSTASRSSEDHRTSDLHCEVIGDGPPILLMHGGLGLDHTCFRPWLDTLADEFSLVYYDHRGNGRSPEPEDWSKVTHSTWAEDAATLIKDLGHERATVLGHSYGGFLALELVLGHPHRVDRLILCDTAPALDYPDVLMANASAKGTPAEMVVFTRATTEGARDDEDMGEIYRALLPWYFAEFEGAWREEVLGDVRFRAAAYNHSFGRCLPMYDVTSSLGDIPVPTLVLGGRHDWICPPRVGPRRLARGISGAELHIFEHSGHYPFVEEPAAFESVVREWLSRSE